MRVLLFLFLVFVFSSAQRLLINRPSGAGPLSPTDSSIFEAGDTSIVQVGFDTVFWPVARYSNNPSSGGDRVVPVICHGEVVWGSEFDAQSHNGATPRERNCWNRNWDSGSAITYSNCLSICSPYNSDNNNIVLQYSSPEYTCAGQYNCRTTDNTPGSYCECRTCGDTKVLPLAYLQPSYGDEDVKTSYLRMTVAGAFSDGMQVLFTLWNDQNSPLLMKTLSGTSSKVYTSPHSYCSNHINKFQVGYGINPSSPTDSSPSNSGWLEGERCQLHEIDFSGIQFLPTAKYWVTIEFRNSYWEIYTSDIRSVYGTGSCPGGLFGKCVTLTSIDGGTIIGQTYNVYCDSQGFNPCFGYSGTTSDTNGNNGALDRGFGHAWISGISFQFLSNVACDTLWENNLINLVSSDSNIRAEKCGASNSAVPNWTCDVCQNLMGGSTECTDETSTTSNGVQIWRKQGQVTAFSGKQDAGFYPNLDESNEKYAYLGMRGVILNPNTVLSMTTLLPDGTTFHWFTPKVADFTNPISFDFYTNNEVFSGVGGQLSNANQFCGNCMLNIWRIDNLPTTQGFFNANFNFNVSVLGAGNLCAADFEVYFSMKDILAPTLVCRDQTYTFTSGSVKTLGLNLVDNYITSTIDNCDWRGDNHAYTNNDGFVLSDNSIGTDSLSIVNYPYKVVKPSRTDTSSNRRTCGQVLAWVNMSPYIIFYPANPVLLKDYLVGTTIGNPLDGTCKQYQNKGNSYTQINVNELKFNWYNKIWTKSGTGSSPGVIVTNAKVFFYAVLADEEAQTDPPPTIFYFNKDAPVPFSPEISSTYGEYRYTGSYSDIVGKSWHLKMEVQQNRNGVAETIIFDSSCVTFVDPHAG